MDLNALLSRHQVAFYERSRGASAGKRQWASLRTDFYAREIERLRIALGRPTRMTWADESRIAAHG